MASQEPRKAISRKKVYSVTLIHVVYRVGLNGAKPGVPRAQHVAQIQSTSRDQQDLLGASSTPRPGLVPWAASLLLLQTSLGSAVLL